MGIEKERTGRDKVDGHTMFGEQIFQRLQIGNGEAVGLGRGSIDIETLQDGWFS